MPDTRSTDSDPVRSAFADDPDFRELLADFATAVPERRQELIDMHRMHDEKTLRTRAHQLKGTGGGYGFPELSALAAELERACDAHDAQRIAEALEDVVGYLNRISV